MVEQGDQGPVLKPFADDEITKAMLVTAQERDQ